MKRQIMLILSMVLLCTGARAQPTCPWFTQGTATTLLGGPATLAIKLLPSGEGSCVFSLQQGPATSLLEVDVANSAFSYCPADSQKLTGIGNEAVICRLDQSAVETMDVLSSRVRSMHFMVRLTVRGKPSPAISTDKRRSLVQQVAEQVAGNLD